MARDWSDGHSPAQNRRFSRVKPTLDRERERLEAWYDRDPEDFYNRIFADLPPEQRAYMERIMEGLPRAQRFDAPGGLMSLIGYGMGDNRATISRYSSDNKGKSAFNIPSTMGFYPIRHNLPPDAYIESTEFRAARPPIRDLPAFKWREGDMYPAAGAGIAVFSPTEDNDLAEDYRTGTPNDSLRLSDIYGTKAMWSEPGTVWHELFHRGEESPAFQAAEKENLIPMANGHPVIASLTPEYAAHNAGTLPSDLPFDPGKARDSYDSTVEYMNKFLTPEREAEYKVTRYHDPSERSLVERIIEDLIRK